MTFRPWEWKAEPSSFAIPGRDLEFPGLRLPSVFQGSFLILSAFTPKPSLPRALACPSPHFSSSVSFPFFPSLPLLPPPFSFSLLPSPFLRPFYPLLIWNICISFFPHHCDKMLGEGEEGGWFFGFLVTLTISGCGPPWCSQGSSSWRHLVPFICSQEEDRKGQLAFSFSYNLAPEAI